MVPEKKGKKEISKAERSHVMDQEELRRVWQEQSQEAFGHVVQWQQSHPQATLAEIEETVHQHIMKLRAQVIQEVAQQQADPPSTHVQQCPHCQTRMHIRGRQKRSLQTQSA